MVRKPYYNSCLLSQDLSYLSNHEYLLLLSKPFVWQDIYAPTPREWATDRFRLFYNTFAPNYTEWPKRDLKTPFDGLNDYIQYVEPLSMYPFSYNQKRKFQFRT